MKDLNDKEETEGAIGKLGSKAEMLKVLRQTIREYENALIEATDTMPSTKDIATKTGTSFPTINGIKKGTIQYISNEMILHISKKLNGPATIAEILSLAEKDNPDISKNLKEKYGTALNWAIYDRDFMEMATQESYIMIIQAAYSSSGTTEEEVVHNLGMVGKKNLDILIEKEMVIKKDDGRIVGRSQGIGMIGPEHIRKFFQSTLSHYGSNRDTANNRIRFHTKSVNEKFQKMLQEEIDKFADFIIEEAKKPEYFGDRKLAIGMMACNFFDAPSGLDNNTKEPIQ